MENIKDLAAAFGRVESKQKQIQVLGGDLVYACNRIFKNRQRDRKADASASSFYIEAAWTHVTYIRGMFARKISVLLTIDRQSQINLQIALRSGSGNIAPSPRIVRRARARHRARLIATGDGKMNATRGRRGRGKKQSGRRRVVFECASRD